MSYTTEIYIDSDGQELIKKTYDRGGIEYTNGQGLTHRLDGPAIIWPDGLEWWLKDGLRHRLDGPACIYPDGSEVYYLEGKQYTKEEYYKKIGKSNEHKSTVPEYTIEDLVKLVGEFKLIIK